MFGSTTPDDRENRPWHAQAGDLLGDNYNVPGLILCALGMVAAVRLLERWSVGWWMAVLSTLLVAGLLVLSGWYLLLVAALGLVAVLVTVIRRTKWEAHGGA